ncbi:MAG: tetratricopeptide repeat protein, partial [Bacteroidia bacterium]|nr:tetratricopeptide repeat protein [Bacteroidia bacterium]
LLSDESSPYDSRRELYMTMIYEKSGMIDSAIVWEYKAHLLKPLYPNSVIRLSSWLVQKNRYSESLQILTDYLKEVKTNPEIWNRTADLLWADGQKDKAIVLLDSAMNYLPGDPAIVNHRKSLIMMSKTAPY